MKSFSVSLLMAFLTLFSVSAQNIRHVFEQDEKIGDFGGKGVFLIDTRKFDKRDF